MKGKPSVTRLKENKKPRCNFTRGYLESLAQVKIATRKVREGGMIFVPKGVRFIGRKYERETVELWETLKGLEIRYKEETLDTVEDYWDNRV